ncbi:MAG TPA: MFS transporter [bacterium]|nr:MFS transporter [Candidatus Omnitrophota bacterium]HOJ60763.1 MFS transporter [bacterium]HOL94850.1 MFS transporter [bacterium]HPO99712.1 MFS transporter [bacterium]HXK94539.1 MFS transporter [bacterium]
MDQQSYLLATLVAVTSVFGLGLSMFMLGSVKLRLTEKLNIDNAQMGKLFSVYNFSNLVFVLVAGIVCDQFGYKTVAVGGFLAAAMAMFCLGQASSYTLAVLACLFLGVGSMFMNTAGNTLLGNPNILYEDPGRSANMGNVFFGVGAFCAPFLTALLFKKTSFNNTLTVMAVILLIPLIFAIAGMFPPAGGNFSASAAAALIGQSQIILCALALMCYIALEVSMAGWITTYMTSVGADETKASQVLSFFSVAIMAGRLFTALVIGGFLNLAAHGQWFVAVLAVVAAIVIYSMRTVNNVGTGTSLVILIGLLFAPMFPTIAGLMFARTDPSVQGTGFSIIFAIGLIGAIFVPAYMGKISSGPGKTIKDSMVVAAAVAAILVVIAVIMGFALPEPLGAAPAAVESAVESAVDAATEAAGSVAP